jgi:Zn-dependent M28 family amino/carboxypeptidase
VRKQVEVGPRPSGTDGLLKAGALIEAELRNCGLNVHRQQFEIANTPRGNVRFCNIIGTTGSWPPKQDVVLLASHYDTKWLPKIRFVGANDAASSTGCLLEIARVLSTTRSKCDFAFVFFDGEEAFDEFTAKDGLYGSRQLAAEMKSDGSLARIRAMILLDMVGDRELKLTIPTADPQLLKAVFDASEALGFREHFTLLGTVLLDDHHPFQLEGVPSIDLIDFQFGPNNAYWHTDRDTIDRLSPRSLEVVGKTVLKMLEEVCCGRK